MTLRVDYERSGFAYLTKFIPPEVASAFLFRLQQDFSKAGVRLDSLTKSAPVLVRDAIEIYGYHYAPMITFLWGMTPAVSALTGKDLLPTYSYFRIYKQGDVCKVHSDRQACEHSLSLTLAYSDAKPWELSVGANHLSEPQPIADDFGDEDYASVAMQPGDAVLYQGVHRRHGRLSANPNRWSAHLFLHWVDRAGPYKDTAFDRATSPSNKDFQLG